MSGSIYCEYGSGSPLPPIDVVQNVYSDLGLSQTLERDGSEWTRSVVDEDILEQSFSDFIGETVTSNLVLSSSVDSDQISLESASTTITFTQTTTVAGGRVDGGGGGSGDTINTFDITYHDGGPSAVAGQVVYIDESDAEAKLASKDANSEVAGVLTEAVTSATPTTIQTEGEINISDWTSIIGATNLIPGRTYYLHTGGQMRPDPPNSGDIVICGRAITATRFDIEINLPWGM